MDWKPIQVLLVDDHAVVRAGYGRLLKLAAGIEVAGEADSGERAYAACRDTALDVIVMDLSPPGMSGIEATKRIRSRYPDVQVRVIANARRAMADEMDSSVTLASDLIEASLIIELLGGRLRLSSRPGRGTGIRAWIPASGARIRAAAAIGKIFLLSRLRPQDTLGLPSATRTTPKRKIGDAMHCARYAHGRWLRSRNRGGNRFWDPMGSQRPG